jgi:hypothetical protein
MKVCIFLLIVLFVLFGCSDPSSATQDETPETIYQLRDRGPAGGWIFYINPNVATDGWTYLEAAPSDSTPQAWSNITNALVNGSTSLPWDIGTGVANSTAIIGQSGHTGSAAKVCLDYSVSNGGVTFDE